MRMLSTRTPGFSTALRQLGRRRLAETTVERRVRVIIAAVRRQGDAAVLRYTRLLDRAVFTRAGLRVTPAEYAAAYRDITPEVVTGLRAAARRITAFHALARPRGVRVRADGIMLAQRVDPLDTVGVYIPGGTAAYPSSLLMNVLPARVAGVRRIVVCSPAPRGTLNPHLLVAADLCGAPELYRVGGAQAIAAMAYGTETIPAVEKIVGPGNRWVAAAKRLVSGDVSVDGEAGPSELAVIADETAVPAWVAADLLSEAEHDPEAWTFLVTPSAALLARVRLELRRQVVGLSRRRIIRSALASHGYLIQTRNMAEAAAVVETLAPEHLEVMVGGGRAEALAGRIRHAGAIFIGPYTPGTVGDYIAGPNHVLPTGGTARTASPLAADDFLKKTNVVAYSRAALRAAAPTVRCLAGAEGLTAHARAVVIREPVANHSDRDKEDA